MKTTYTIVAILASVLFTQTVSAKLGSSDSATQFETSTGINIKTEIVNNINMMLANVQAPTVKTDVFKQLVIDTVETQANEMVQLVGERLPGFKFKVILAE